MSRQGLVDALRALDPDLWAALAPVQDRCLHWTSQDWHAVRAVEVVASRGGLRVLLTTTDDGWHHVTVRGFSK